jgi:hypothetical protein
MELRKTARARAARLVYIGQMLRALVHAQVDVIARRILEVQVNSQVDLRRLDVAMTQVEADLLDRRAALSGISLSACHAMPSLAILACST